MDTTVTGDFTGADTAMPGDGSEPDRRDAAPFHGGMNPLRDEGAAGETEAARVPLRELMDGRLLDALLERSKDAAGGCG